MDCSEFDYHLPKKLIAERPLEEREQAKLLRVSPNDTFFEHHIIKELPDLLKPSDVLIFNESKVFPARLKGTIDSKSVEILLHRDRGEGRWECLTKPGKKFLKGTEIVFPKNLCARVQEIHEDGGRVLKFNQNGKTFETTVDVIGETPLPPYIKTKGIALNDYQTVYAKHRGSVAAPTAGLHFTAPLLEALKKNGIETCALTLHVGRGTFEPIKTEKVEDHVMHREWFDMSTSTASALNHARQTGRRLIAVGTTTARVLETCADDKGKFHARSGETRIFIHPGHTFKGMDGLLTNFHLPKSTLLMLVSALAGTETMRAAYREAIQNNYRFFSFGDAMLIL